jgi:hypothetical protein
MERGAPKILSAYFPTLTRCLFHSPNQRLCSSILRDIFIQYCSGYSYSSLREIIEPWIVFSGELCFLVEMLPEFFNSLTSNVG